MSPFIAVFYAVGIAAVGICIGLALGFLTERTHRSEPVPHDPVLLGWEDIIPRRIWPPRPNIIPRCPRHGDRMVIPEDGSPRCRTREVLEDVDRERRRQYSMYGNNESNALGIDGKSWLPMFTGASAHEIEAGARRHYENWEDHGLTVTRAMLAREEFCEFMAATSKENLREEAIQVAAIMVALVESVDAGVYDDQIPSGPAQAEHR